MKFKKPQIVNAWLFVVLFLAFFSYRLYFWGDPGKHIIHVFLNSLGDAIFSYLAGWAIFKLKGRYLKRKWTLYLTSSIVLIISVGFIYGYHLLVYKLFNQLNKGFLEFFNAICFQLLDSVAIILTGSFAVVIDSMHKEKNSISHQLDELNREKLMTELKYLKAQIDPHFVFNSLNTIFYQVKDDDKIAKESIVQFSDILRYHMQNSSQSEVLLNDEMKYIKSYIEFQSKRNRDFLCVKSKFDLEENDFRIEPLLLMPLIENAFKFVNPEGIQKGWIDIWAKFKTNRFEFSVKNSFNPMEVAKNTGARIGLQNVLKRLNILYRDKHHFEIENLTGEGQYICNLTLWK